MTRRKETEEAEAMITVTLRADRKAINIAKAKAKSEGRSLGVIFRKMMADWLSGKYKPFDN